MYKWFDAKQQRYHIVLIAQAWEVRDFSYESVNWFQKEEILLIQLQNYISKTLKE
jgi:hypothetical protein